MGRKCCTYTSLTSLVQKIHINKSKLRHKSDVLLNWFVGAMRSSGKFLVILRQIRERKAIKIIGKILRPYLKKWKQSRVFRIIEFEKDFELFNIRQKTFRKENKTKLVLSKRFLKKAHSFTYINNLPD